MVTRRKAFTRASGKLDAQGRLLVPAEIRERLGLKPGERLILVADDDELRVATPAGNLRKLRKIVEPLIDPSRSMVDELIAERRAEAARE